MSLYPFCVLALLLLLLAVAVFQAIQVRTLRQAIAAHAAQLDAIEQRRERDAATLSQMQTFLYATDEELADAVRMAIGYDNCGTWSHLSRLSKARSARASGAAPPAPDGNAGDA